VRTCIALALLGVAASAPVARGDTLGYPGYPDDAGPVPAVDARWEIGVSPSAGFVQADQAHGMWGGRVHGGVELGRIAALGELELYDLQSTGDASAPGSGAGHELRGGLDFRYDVVQRRMLHRPRGGGGRYERLDVSVDGGLGVESIAIGDAAARQRIDIAAGIGVMMTNRGGAPSFGLRARVELAPPFADAAAAATPATSTRTQPALDPTFVVGFVVSLGD
jgi:hypothetical protein